MGYPKVNFDNVRQSSDINTYFESQGFLFEYIITLQSIYFVWCDNVILNPENCPGKNYPVPFKV